MNNEKLSGFVLVSRGDKLLTRQKVWMDASMTGGWIWSEEEIKQIVKDAKQWESKPMYKRAAYLNKENGQTVIFGKTENMT